MIDIQVKKSYKAFGLNIISEVPLPELQLRSSYNVIDNDIDILFDESGTIIKHLNGIQKKLVVEDNLVMFQVDETAAFCIKDGKKIIVAPFEGADPDRIRLFILGSCMGAILTQRRILPLHGSAVVMDGKAYAIVGDRGAGKSTLACALINNGCRLLSDDIIAISLTKDNIPYVIPAFPQQKLWKDSLEELGMEKGNYRPLFQREEKFSVPVQSQFVDYSLPLGGIFELVKNDDEAVHIQRIQGLNQLNTLRYHTFRRSLISGFDVIDWHFNFTVKICQQVGMYQVKRPSKSFTVRQIVELFLNTIN